MIFSHLLDSLESIIYHLIGVAYSFSSAQSVVYFLEKYPTIHMDGEDIKLTYNIGEMGIQTLELWYSMHRGYYKAIFTSTYDGSKSQFSCHAITTNNWMQVPLE